MTFRLVHIFCSSLMAFTSICRQCRSALHRCSLTEPSNSLPSQSPLAISCVSATKSRVMVHLLLTLLAVFLKPPATEAFCAAEYSDLSISDIRKRITTGNPLTAALERQKLLRYLGTHYYLTTLLELDRDDSAKVSEDKCCCQSTLRCMPYGAKQEIRRRNISKKYTMTKME